MKLVSSLVSLAALTVIFGACAVASTPISTGPDNTPDGGSSKDSGKDSSSSGNDSGGMPDTSTGNMDSSMPIDDTACGAMPLAACESCCVSIHKTGYKTYLNALSGCACTGVAACASQCSSEFCAMTTTTSGDPCDTCLQAAVAPMGTCYNDVATACMADPDCLDVETVCFAGCH